jgi:glycerol-1-phosphate dehydrogenase [NAD(P)+]
MAFQQLNDVHDFLIRTSSSLANTVLTCPYCGRVHKIPYQAILVGPGVIQQVPELVKRALGHAPQRVGVIFDQAIEEFVEQEFLAAFAAGGLPIFRMPLGEEGFWLDSTRELGDEAALRVPIDVDLLIAAGSGVICDLTKWIATHSHKPYILCGSAPSMNGYTSITAVINEHDIKLTKYVDIPYAVVLDTNILVKAPAEMVQAGVGDLAARAICNADWRLSNFLHGSYFCPLPYQMTAASETHYLAAAEGIRAAKPGAIADLAEAIAISGLSMSILDGETSPSSGGEHVISHYWDFMSHLEDAPRNLHGAQVGVGTQMMLAAYEYFRQIDPACIDADRLVRERLSLEQIQARNTARFGAAAAPLNETSQKKYLTPEIFSSYVHKAVTEWEAMWAAISPYTAAFQMMHDRMQAAGVPLSLNAIQRTKQQALDALLFGGRYRLRYTFLDLAWDLGLFPEAAEEILERSGVLNG